MLLITILLLATMICSLAPIGAGEESLKIQMVIAFGFFGSILLLIFIIGFTYDEIKINNEKQNPMF